MILMLKFFLTMNNWELMGISQVIELFPSGELNKEEDEGLEKIFKVKKKKK